MKNMVFFILAISILLLAPFATSGATTKLYYSSFSDASLDGVISDNEYPTTFEVKDDPSGNVFLTVSWGHNGTHIFLAMTGELTGWIGFGMNEPGKGMTGADMVISSVQNGKVVTGDYYATGNTPPFPDADQFPIDAAGTEENGVTTIELRFPLKSSDTAGQDHNWEVGGTYGFFFAAHSDSDELTYHSWRSTATYSVEIAPESETPEQQTVDLAGSNSAPFAIFGGIAALIAVSIKLRRKID